MKTKVGTTLYALFLSIFFVFVVSCSSYNNNDVDATAITKAEEATVTPASLIDFTEDTNFFSEIDFSSIDSPEDYLKVRNNLFEEYMDANMKFYESYLMFKMKAFSIYSEKEKEAVMVFRKSSEEDYLNWLDAEKTRDYERLSQIEKNPSYIEYKSVKDREYAIFKETEKSLHEVYLKKQEALYNERERRGALAYSAYKKNK